MEEQLKRWQDERDAAAAAQAASEAEAARLRAQEDLDAKQLVLTKEQELRQEFSEREARWEQRLAQIEADREQERVLLEKDRAFAQLQAYIQRRVNEEAENIAPELVDLISGNSPEEVEASITRMRDKTAAILNGVSEAQVALASQMRGVSPTGFGANGPLEQQTGTKTYTAEEIAAMPMLSYLDHRLPEMVEESSAKRK
jgi:hypothetical protein